MLAGAVGATSALQYAITLLANLPGLIEKGVDLVSTIKEHHDVLAEARDEQRDPTGEQWDRLNSAIAGELKTSDAQVAADEAEAKRRTDAANQQAASDSGAPKV